MRGYLKGCLHALRDALGGLNGRLDQVRRCRKLLSGKGLIIIFDVIHHIGVCDHTGVTELLDHVIGRKLTGALVQVLDPQQLVAPLLRVAEAVTNEAVVERI